MAKQPSKRVRTAFTKYVKSQNARVKMPSRFTPAEVRVNSKGEVQIRMNPSKSGKFAKCVKSVEAEGGAYDPRAVCASAGRKKFGAKKFAAMAKAGKKRANPARYKVVRIDNGLRQPHTGLVRAFKTEEKARDFIDRSNRSLRKKRGYSTSWHPYAILDTETGEKYE